LPLAAQGKRDMTLTIGTVPILMGYAYLQPPASKLTPQSVNVFHKFNIPSY